MFPFRMLLLVGGALCVALGAALLPLPLPVHQATVVARPQLAAPASEPVPLAESAAGVRELLPPASAWSAAHTATQVIVVSRTDQRLWAFAQGQLVFTSEVSTGRPGLETPSGTFHVLAKATNLIFISPWPRGSPNYYTPEHINFALFFHDVGFYIHDAPWRELFGPGSNLPHTNPDGTAETGSHGCVNVPTGTGAWLFHWADIGATIIILP